MSREQAKHARRFERLAVAPLDLATLPEQLLDALADVVSFDSFCWGAVDPKSLLPTRATGTTFPAASPLLWEVRELAARDPEPEAIHAFAGRSVMRLPDTAGTKEQSPMYRRILRPMGLEHQLRAALVLDGAHWGLLNIERRAGRPDFSAGEVALVEALIPHFAHAFRRWLLAEASGTRSAAHPALPGVIVLDEDHEIDSISPEAEHWLSEWGLADLKTPPAAIAAVSAAARARADGSSDNDAERTCATPYRRLVARARDRPRAARSQGPHRCLRRRRRAETLRRTRSRPFRWTTAYAAETWRGLTCTGCRSAPAGTSSGSTDASTKR